MTITRVTRRAASFVVAGLAVIALTGFAEAQTTSITVTWDDTDFHVGGDQPKSGEKFNVDIELDTVFGPDSQSFSCIWNTESCTWNAPYFTSSITGITIKLSPSSNKDRLEATTSGYEVLVWGSSSGTYQAGDLSDSYSIGISSDIETDLDH